MIDLSRLVDIDVLAKSLPQLALFRARGTGSHPNEAFPQLIILLVTHFEHLVELIFNEGSTYRRDGYNGVRALREQKARVNEMLRSTPKLRDPDRSSIDWNGYVELKIRL